MITKIADTLTSNRYNDTTNELLVNYINSGEAKQYGRARDLAAPIASIIAGSSAAGLGVGLAGGPSAGIKGARIGGGLGVGISGLALYANHKRKKSATKFLDSGSNRKMLARKLEEAKKAGVNIHSPNSLNGYLNSQLKNKKKSM